MNPVAGDVHVNQPLTNISIAFMQDAANFVADRIFTNIPVVKQSDRYYTYDRGYFNRDEMEERAESSESAGGDYTVDSTPTYYAPVYAFHHDISDPRRANSDSVLAPDREATELCTLKGLIKREKLWVAKYFLGGVWTAGDVDGVASGENNTTTFLQWNDADSDPIKNIREGVAAILERTGYKPNTLVLGYRVWMALQDHPDIVDRIKYGNTSGVANITTADLSNLFKIPRIFVMEAVENTAKEGQTNSHSFIGGKKALLCYSEQSPGLMKPTAGYTFSWTGYLGASPNGARIKRFRMEQIASDRVEIEMAFDQKLVSAELGYFWDTIVA